MVPHLLAPCIKGRQVTNLKIRLKTPRAGKPYSGYNIILYITTAQHSEQSSHKIYSQNSCPYKKTLHRNQESKQHY